MQISQYNNCLNKPKNAVKKHNSSIIVESPCVKKQGYGLNQDKVSFKNNLKKSTDNLLYAIQSKNNSFAYITEKILTDKLAKANLNIKGQKFIVLKYLLNICDSNFKINKKAREISEETGIDQKRIEEILLDFSNKKYIFSTGNTSNTQRYFDKDFINLLTNNSNKLDIDSVISKLEGLGINIKDNEKFYNFTRWLISQSKSPDGNFLASSNFSNADLGSYTTFDKYMKIFETQGFANKISNGKNPNWFINSKFHEFITGRKVIKEGIMVFDKNAIENEILSDIITNKKLKKFEDNKQVCIQFDKTNWGSVYSILNTLASKNQPALVVISKESLKGSSIPEGIRVIFTDYVDDVINNTISPEFVCNSKIKLGTFHQLIIELLLKKDGITPRKFCSNIGYSYQTKYKDYFYDLKNLGIVNEANNKYSLNPEFLKKIKNEDNNFEITPAIETILTSERQETNSLNNLQINMEPTIENKMVI